MYSYVVRKKVNKSGSEEEIRYHGIPVTSGQIGVSQMAEVISERCSLTHADVEASVIALGEVMQEFLSKGHTVYLKGIGLFSVSASSEGYSTAKECTPSKVKAKRICFKADKYMKVFMGKIKFIRTKRAPQK